MTAAVWVAVTCHYCSRGRAPAEIIYMPGGIQICLDCYHRHREGVMALAGKPPTECSECHAAWEPGAMMAVHYEHGLYRCMCLPCSDKYVPKRRDIYGPTEYGWKKKLV